METTIKVSGMSCMHCVGAVKKALEELDGVDAAEVSLEDASATISGTISAEAAASAVREAGYEAET